jgi:hypothetical protein
VTFHAILLALGSYIYSHAAIILLALYAWANNWWGAFTASLPNPDDPSDWNVDGSWRKYKLMYKTIRQANNQKPQPISVPPNQVQQVIIPKS